MRRPRILLALGLALIWAVPAPASVDRSFARQVYQKSLALYLTGDFHGSLKAANEAIKEDSGLVPAYALRARVYGALGDPSGMIKDADHALSRLGGNLSKMDTEELIAHGSALVLEGRPEEALQSFSAALQLDSRSPEALAGRARAWRALGRHDKAVEDLSAASRLVPRATLYLYNRAGAYYELGRSDEALVDLMAALRLSPSFAPGFGMLGSVLAKKGDLKRALAAYNKALAVDPDYSYPYLGRAALRLSAGDEKGAFADLGEAVRADPRSFAPYFNRAEAYWRAGKKDEALADYRQAAAAAWLEADHALKIGDRLAQLLLWKEAVGVYTRAYQAAGGEGSGRRDVPISAAGGKALIRRAKAFEALKETKKAYEDLTEAVERDPSSAAAWAARGGFALRIGNDRQALADLDQAVKLEPKDAEVRTARGSYYAKVGKPRAAMDDFDAAVQADPRLADAYNNRGALYVNAFNDPEKALKDIQSAVELNPKDPGYRFNLAMMRLKSRHYRTAVESFTAALQLKGPAARILEKRAEARFLLGDHTKSLQDIQVAIEKDPGYAALYDELGSMRLRSHDYEQAIRDLNQALQFDSDHSPALTHRGLAYAALGNVKAATKDLRRGAEADPRSREAFAALCQLKRLTKDPRGAVKDCDKAVDIDPYYGAAYLQRGLTQFVLRETAKSVEDMGAAAQLGVRRAEGLLAQAVGHAAEGQYRQAHRDYEQAMLLDPAAHSMEIGFSPRSGDPEDFYNAIMDLEPQMKSDVRDPYVAIVLGDAHHNAQHYDKAIFEYTKAMETDGTLADAYVGRGLCLMAQEAWDAAQQDFIQAAQLSPRDPQIRLRLATLLTIKGTYRQALEEAVKALKLDGRHSEGYLRAGNIHYFLREYQRALDNYDLAVRYDPASANAYNGVGLGLFALRKYPEAIENFSRAITLNPLSDRFHRNRASAYVNMKDYANAAEEYKTAAALNLDPAMAEEYKKLIDDAEAKAGLTRGKS